MRISQTLRTTIVHEPLRKPLRPRHYWIRDQVVRRTRRQEDVAGTCD